MADLLLTPAPIRGLFTLTLLALPLLGFGQETRKITRSNNSPASKEVFYALKSDEKVRHGAYELYGGRRGKLSTKGYYTNGRKDSIWTSYADDGTTVLAKGKYRNDQRVGVWELYDYKGELEEKYDFSNRILVEAHPAAPVSPEPFLVVLQQPTADGQNKPQLNPLYIGGPGMLLGYLSSFRLPQAAIRNHVRGKVWIGFTIDAEGNASDYRVVQGLGNGCDEEALRVVQSAPGTWVPALVAGRPVAVDYAVPISIFVQ